MVQRLGNATVTPLNPINTGSSKPLKGSLCIRAPRGNGPKCLVIGKRIQGIPHLKPTDYKRFRLSRNRRTTNRAYGGVFSGSAVRERIIRAFLVDEQKTVKKVLKIQKANEKLASKT